MARQVLAEVLPADQGLRRFIDHQLTEARRLGNDDLEALARDLSGCKLISQPEANPDPLIKAAAGFYLVLNETERRLLAERGLKLGTDKERAQRLGKSLGGYYMSLDRVLWRCTGYFQAVGVFTSELSCQYKSMGGYGREFSSC